MKNINSYMNKGSNWLPKEEWIKQQRAKKKAVTCAFNDYNDVTQEMVDRFWLSEKYIAHFVTKDKISPEFRDSYEKAKKNAAMLDYVMKPTYTVYFDKDANIKVFFNDDSVSRSEQNHVWHYGWKCSKYFKFDATKTYDVFFDETKWEILYDGKQ